MDIRESFRAGQLYCYFAWYYFIYQLFQTQGLPIEMPTTESGVISDWCLVPALHFDFWTERTSKQPLFCYPEAISFNKLWISRGQLLGWKHVIFHLLPATSMRHADLQSHTHAHFSRGWGKFVKYVQGKWSFCIILRLIGLEFFSEAAGFFERQSKTKT